jgi:tripartite ATP-independent transporter DctM subunit
MSAEVVLTIGMFGGLILLIMFGVSLSFAMGSIAVIAGFILYGTGSFMSIVAPVFDYMWMLLLAAVPLFVFIGVTLSSSKISEDMYEAFYLWSGRIRGGLAVGSCGFAAALSAMTGNCSASTVTAGLVGIPPMRNKGYHENIIFGTIGAAGTLGILIPPSISLIIIGMLIGESIGKLFAGGLAAGMVILFSFIAYILVRAYINPDLAPAPSEKVDFATKLRALKSVALPVLIIGSVLGTIFFGIATPTEAAAVGAVAVVFAVILRGEFNWKFIKKVTYQTGQITGMVIWIMFGAGAFVSIYSSGGGLYFFQSLLTGLDLNPWVLFIGMQLFVLLLGMFLDPMGIILLCLPIFFPIVQGMGFDPIWFAILFNINLCIGYITPPFGYNLFYLKSLSPETSMKTIYTSALPFILIMLTCEALMLIFPEIILFLPRIMVF